MQGLLQLSPDILASEGLMKSRKYSCDFPNTSKDLAILWKILEVHRKVGTPRTFFGNSSRDLGILSDISIQDILSFTIYARACLVEERRSFSFCSMDMNIT